jgi:anionic cell wall polymer biosynthesis LytR-Cps2A-Psr (LCP) family protein
MTIKRVLIIFLGFILAFGAIFVVKAFDVYNTINTSTSGSNPKKVNQEKTTYNILLLGYGGLGHEGAYLTDTIMVVHLDTKTNKAVLISIPRDLWVEVPGETKPFHAKINSVYEMGLYPDDYPSIPKKYTGEQGAAELAKTVVGNIVKLPIDYYVGVDFGGFRKIVDTLGGLDVNVETTFDDYVYPIDGKENDTCGKKDDELQKALDEATESAETAFPCRYEHIHFDKGVNHMDGFTALKYARSRHSLQDGTDFGRAKRQQLVLEAVKEKVLSVSFLPKVFPLMDQAKEYVRMDMDISILQKLFSEAKKDGNKYTIVNLVPSLENFLKNDQADNGQYILSSQDGLDEWGAMQKWISDTIEGITPTPTPGPTTATSSAKLTPKKSGE